MSEESPTKRIGSASGSDYAPEGVRPTDPLIGRVIEGRYRILKPLSTGGMGSVFLGKQLNVDRHVAIKLITSAAPGLQTRFQREAQALAAVSHPAIVEIHDFISAGVEGQYFLIMAYIDGIDLEEFLSLQPKGRLKAGEVLSLIIPVASALVELHAGGILHRDIKPSNIVRFLRADRRAGVKLVDFGIARREMDPSLTAEGVIMGTPPYLAPEVMLGKKHSRASDVYALGATMFELLTGTAPFGKDELHQVMKRTVHDPLLLPQELEGSPLGGLLLDLLHKDPEMRPESLELLGRLERMPPGRRDCPATITIDPITSPEPNGQEDEPPTPGGTETVADTGVLAADQMRDPLPGSASDRILRRLAQPRPRRLMPSLLLGLAGMALGVLLMLVLGPGYSGRGGGGATAGKGRVIVATRGHDRAGPDREDASPPMGSGERSSGAGRLAERHDAAVKRPMVSPMEPMAPPSMASLRRRCKKSRYQPRIMLSKARKILKSGTHDPDSLELARRILHVLLQGGCVKPFSELQRQAAFLLASLYIHKGACYSARNVWRMYAKRFKRAFPYRKRPPFPPCRLRAQ